MANESQRRDNPGPSLFRNAISAPFRDALIAFMAATAQAQRRLRRKRSVLAHAKANGDARAYKGRKPSYCRKQFERECAGQARGCAVAIWAM